MTKLTYIFALLGAGRDYPGGFTGLYNDMKGDLSPDALELLDMIIEAISDIYLSGNMREAEEYIKDIIAEQETLAREIIKWGAFYLLRSLSDDDLLKAKRYLIAEGIIRN